MTILSCIDPSNINEAVLEAVDETSFTISWTPPQDNGGCPVTGYKIFRDDGAGGDINNEIDASTVNNKPALYQHSTTLGGSFTGKTIRVKVEALTSKGSVLTPALSFVLADVPGAPTPAPLIVTSESTTEKIELKFDNTNPDDGGSPVILVELQMDDGNQGNFISVLNTTYLTQLTITDVERGNFYRFRYRVANVNGYSDWSSVAYLTPTSQPDAPPAPQFASGTSTTVTLNFEESEDNNGV